MKLPANLSIDDIIDSVEEQMTSLENPGFCLACGEMADSCEPDAAKYKCESCGKREVYGAGLLLIMFGDV